MGVGAQHQTALELSNGLLVWKRIGCGVAVVGGCALLSAEATTSVTNTCIRLKLGVLTPLAPMWHIVVHKNVRAWTRHGQTLTIGKCAGLIELSLWISVVIASVGFLFTNAVTHP